MAENTAKECLSEYVTIPSCFVGKEMSRLSPIEML